MNREDLINFIPVPENKDVILYDTSLKDLVDVNVLEEYNKILPIYNNIKSKIDSYNLEIKEYEEMINNTYLYKSNWSEEDYLYNLQNENKIYAKLFNPIKKMESNIEILLKKSKNIESKLQVQKAKELKEEENKKNNIDKIIDESLEKLIKLKENQSEFKVNNKILQEKMEENEKDFDILKGIIEDIENGEYKCRYCGHKISNMSKNSFFYRRTSNNIEENQKSLKRILEQKERNDKQIEEYNIKIKAVKKELDNAMSFKKQDHSLYKKKSLEVLRLEGIKDELLNQISELENKINSNPDIKKEKFIDIKKKIKKYETSLENLKKIKEFKNAISQKISEINELKNTFEEIEGKIKKYKTFLTIFFKIYEKKAADYCGQNFKFKIFDFKEYNLIETFKIYYNGIEYENLNKSSKRLVDCTLNDKILFTK